MRKTFIAILFIPFITGLIFTIKNNFILKNELRETGEHSWLQPVTKRCKLDLGGDWFTSSVERVCEFCTVPYSCTAVPCGEAFYN